MGIEIPTTMSAVTRQISYPERPDLKNLISPAIGATLTSLAQAGREMIASGRLNRATETFQNSVEPAISKTLSMTVDAAQTAFNRIRLIDNPQGQDIFGWLAAGIGAACVILNSLSSYANRDRESETRLTSTFRDFWGAVKGGASFLSPFVILKICEGAKDVTSAQLAILALGLVATASSVYGITKEKVYEKRISLKERREAERLTNELVNKIVAGEATKEEKKFALSKPFLRELIVSRSKARKEDGQRDAVAKEKLREEFDTNTAGTALSLQHERQFGEFGGEPDELLEIYAKLAMIGAETKDDNKERGRKIQEMPRRISITK